MAACYFHGYVGECSDLSKPNPIDLTQPNKTQTNLT
jgi:hypothetical protein